MNASLLNLNEWLRQATKQLERAGIGTARLDCLVLLEDVTGKDRGWLLAHPEFVAKGPTLSNLDTLIARRARHEPLAYIRGKTEFYGREFVLSKQVLEPRPESETIIDLLKELTPNLQKLSLLEDSPLTGRGISIVDVGTGSGAIGITVALEFPGTKVILTDIDPECLKIAKKNAKQYSVEVTYILGDLLEPLQRTMDYGLWTILANLPYVPDHYEINEAALMEPRIAIFGGPDGLDLYRRMFNQILKMQIKPEYIFTESLPFQHNDLGKIAETAGYVLKETTDFIQLFV